MGAPHHWLSGRRFCLARSGAGKRSPGALVQLRLAREHALEAHISGTIAVQRGAEGKRRRFRNSGLVPLETNAQS
jgi:hypothetical protein